MVGKVTFRKKLTIGRVKGEEFGYKRSLKVDIEIEIRRSEWKGKTIDLENVSEKNVLAITGDVWNVKQSDVIMCGQIQNEIRRWINENKFKELYIDKDKLLKILEIWDRWHLNDLHAGTRRQRETIKEWRKKNNITGYAFDKEVEYLKSIGLYEDNGYRYGSAWLYEPLPSEVIEFVEKL